MIKKFLLDTNGTTAIEYALLGTLIGVFLVGAMTSIGSNTTLTLTNIQGYF